jgi:hypothetical protein
VLFKVAIAISGQTTETGCFTTAFTGREFLGLLHISGRQAALLVFSFMPFDVNINHKNKIGTHELFQFLKMDDIDSTLAIFDFVIPAKALSNPLILNEQEIDLISKI